MLCGERQKDGGKEAPFVLLPYHPETCPPSFPFKKGKIEWSGGAREPQRNAISLWLVSALAHGQNEYYVVVKQRVPGSQGIIRCDSKLSHGFAHFARAVPMVTRNFLDRCSKFRFIHIEKKKMNLKEAQIRRISIQPWEESIGPVVMHSYVCINSRAIAMLISNSIQTKSRGSRQQLTSF